jgi:DNA-binding CsgD family transcriptional regulator
MPDARPPLTDQQRRCLWLAHYRLTSKEIGLALSISENTVNNHLKEAMWRLNANDRRTAAAAAALDMEADPLVQKWLDQTLAMAIPDAATLRRRTAKRAMDDDDANTDAALDLGRPRDGPDRRGAAPEAANRPVHADPAEGRRGGAGAAGVVARGDGRRRHHLWFGSGRYAEGGQNALSPFELLLLVAAAVCLLLILGEALVGHLIKILQQLSH